MKKLISFFHAGDRWATAYKNGSSIYTIVISLIVLIAVLFILNTTPELVERENVSGVVTAVNPMKDSSRQYGWLIDIELTDGKTTRLLINRQPIPDVGDQIPLIKETYDNGDVLINFRNGIH